MTTLIFVLFWVLLGLGLLIVALSGGTGGALQRLQTQSRGGRKAAIVLFAVAFIVLGFGIPAAVIAAINSRNDIPSANVSNLTAAEQHGRELFGQSCALCHTLKASNAVAQVGPDLDQISPNKALVLNTIRTGRSSGNGQMPAQLFTGQDAADVAEYVARVAGSGS
jgi:mono/diheme cytochrome c family protein